MKSTSKSSKAGSAGGPEAEAEELKKLLEKEIESHKETSAKLQIIETQFQTLMANSLDAIVLCDKDFNILYRSPTAFKLSGWTDEDHAKNHPFTNTHPEDQQNVKEKLAEALQTKDKPISVTYRSRHKNGHYFWIEGTFRNMLEEPIKAIVISIRDVSSRKEAESRTAESEEKFKTLIERISDAFISFDKDLRYTYMNKKGGEITHRDPQSLIGKYVWDVFPEAIGSSTWETFNKAMSEQVYLCNTDYFEPLNLWQENHLYPSENGLSVFIRDISERKRAEKKLIESEQRFRTLIENSSDAIVLADENIKVIYQSPSVERITGISMAYREANPNTSFAHPEDRQIIADAIENSKKNPGAPIGFQCRVHRLDGNYIWIEGVMSNQLANPDIKAMVFNYRDVSERKNAEAEILKLNDELEEKVVQRTEQLEALNKELESFTYSVSHDLRAPLRIIDGFSQIVMDDYADKLDDSGKKNLSIIVRNAKRMGMLIDDLLNFSKVGKAQIRISEVDMNSIVSEVIEELAMGNVQIPAGLQIKELKSIRADHALIKQVWINLISNAIKYSAKKETPEIEIGSYLENNNIVYFVKDNGAGFDMQYVHKLFGVFQRLHKLEEFTGTGVGLALVQRILVRHEGTVWAEGKVNEGATFYFALPVR